MNPVASYRLRTLAARLLIFCLLFLLSLAILLPLLIAVLGSFKTAAEASSFSLRLPTKWMTGNYVEVFTKGRMLNALKNSVLITTFTVAAVIIVSSMASFVLSRRVNRLTGFLTTFFTLGIIVPLSIVPSVLIMKVLGLLNSRVGISLLYIGIRTPWAIFLLVGFIRGVPREMDEAAIMDGASPLVMFFKVIFPLLKPIVFTCTILTAMGTWNDFILPLYFLTNQSYKTLPLTVYNFFSQYQSSWNLVFANLVLTALPIIALYLFCQKYIVAGMTAGAVKS